MQYDDFIYKLIKLMMQWGAWNEPIKILYGNKIYTPCQNNEEKNCFQDLKNVAASDAKANDKEFQKRWPKKCELYVELNSQLNNLFEFGVLETNLEDLPIERKVEEYKKRKNLQEEFRNEYDEEQMKEYSECYEIPSELEFDSADEYKKFIAEEIEEAEKKFIANLSGTVEFGNDLEAEICNLCIDYNLSYDCEGGGLFIGHDYF